MNISKKIISYILIGFLCVSSCSITYYKSVHAFEWVEVGISTAEALKWLLGALGIAATGSAAIDNFWSGYEEEFYEYASDENISGPDVRAWLEKLAKGTLDKGSQVWDIFKTWASSLVLGNSGGSNVSFGISNGEAPLSVVNKIMDFFGYGSVNSLSNVHGSNVRAVIVTKYRDYAFVSLFYDNVRFTLTSPYVMEMSASCVYDVFKIQSNTATRNSGGNSYSYDLSSGAPTYLSDNIVGYDNNPDLAGVIGIDVVVGTSDFDTIGDARQDQFDIINRNTGNEVEQEVAIPMPGVSSGDDTISHDSYDAIMDRVEAGEISIDDAISEIQQILQVLVYDTETDDVIPISPDPLDPNENQKKDDVLKEEKENMGFTLAGLENFFPFCIPWDIYAFLNILDAEPVAPVFNIPFPNVDDPEHPLTTQVDLSSWDDAMAIVRLAQDFLFIIGLAFLTRSLIGAGGGD